MNVNEIYDVLQDSVKLNNKLISILCKDDKAHKTNNVRRVKIESHNTHKRNNHETKPVQAIKQYRLNAKDRAAKYKEAASIRYTAILYLKKLRENLNKLNKFPTKRKLINKFKFTNLFYCNAKDGQNLTRLYNTIRDEWHKLHNNVEMRSEERSSMELVKE